MRKDLLFVMAAAMLAPYPAPAQTTAPDVLGFWQCEYSVRDGRNAARTSAAWFQITLHEGADFTGGGKAVAGGSTLNTILHGKWVVDADNVLKLTGVSQIAQRELPFRFISQVMGPDRIERQWEHDQVRYHTRCVR